MATCRIEGLDELIDQMERMAKKSEPIFEEMTTLGASVVKECWQESADKHDLKLTGEMKKAIDFDKKPKRFKNRLESAIYPRGYQTYTIVDGKRVNRKDRVRLAAVAFIRHYGTSRRPATYWVDTAEELAADRVPPVLEDRWERYLLEGE